MLSLLDKEKQRSIGSEILPPLYSFANREAEALRNSLLGDSCQQATRAARAELSAPYVLQAAEGY